MAFGIKYNGKYLNKNSFFILSDTIEHQNRNKGSMQMKLKNGATYLLPFLSGNEHRFYKFISMSR